MKRNVSQKLEGLLDTGELRDDKKHYQAYYTPPDIVAEIITAAGKVLSGRSVLEPSAGHGAIALAAKAAGGDVTCVELDPAAVTILKIISLPTEEGDFLTMGPKALGYYDRVLMNPPFTNSADLEHVFHAYTFLKPSGILVAVMSAGALTNQTRKGQAFAKLVKDTAAEVFKLPDRAFSDSGTDVHTVMVVMPKKKSINKS